MPNIYWVLCFLPPYPRYFYSPHIPPASISHMFSCFLLAATLKNSINLQIVLARSYFFKPYLFGFPYILYLTWKLTKRLVVDSKINKILPLGFDQSIIAPPIKELNPLWRNTRINLLFFFKKKPLKTFLVWAICCDVIDGLFCLLEMVVGALESQWWQISKYEGISNKKKMWFNLY